MWVIDQRLTHFLFPGTVLDFAVSCGFWGGNENLWEIVASSPLLSDHSRSRPFSCAAVMFIVVHEHPLELVHASYMASLKTDFLCTLISGDYSISGGERKLSSFKVEALINYLCCNFWQAMETSSPMKMPYCERSKQEFLVWWWQGMHTDSVFLNPLNPKSDQHQISPCNINAL